MNYYLRNIVLFAFVIYFNEIFANNPKHIEFEHITINQGLSQNTVFDMVQDRNGFIWIGTENGINKYNGYEFISYSIDLKNPYSLSENSGYSVFEDHAGSIWVGTRNGLNKFDEKLNGFIKYFHNHLNDSSICPGRINDIVEDEYHNLWIGTNFGLSHFIRERNVFENFYHIPGDTKSLINDIVNSLFFDKDGKLWIGTNDGISILSPLTREFIHYTTQQGLKGNEIYSFLEDHEGNIWIGTNVGILNKFDPKKNKFDHYVYSTKSSEGLFNNAHALHQDKYNVIWVGTYGGLYSFESDTFIHFDYILDDPNSLNNNRIRSFVEDRSGAMWVGTRGGGLNKFDNTRKQFKLYRKEAKENSLCHNSVYSFAEDDNNKIWIATIGGISYLDLETDEYINYKNDPHNPNSLSNDQVWCLIKDSFGKLWIGCEKGVNEFDPKTGVFNRYMHDSKDSTSLSSNSVYSIFEDAEKTLWVGTMFGLNRFDRKTKSFIRYYNIPGDSTSISNDLIWNFIEDKYDTLWIATNKGLNKYLRTTDSFLSYFHKGDDGSISNDNIFCMIEDTKGELWIGTNIGINRYLRKQNQFVYYTKKDGLVDNVIYGMQIDDKNNLWMSSNAGIMVFNEDRLMYRNYTIYDGLQSNEFNFANYKLEDGRMLFGGVDGFNIFHPDSIKDNEIVPPVVITDFKLFNKSVKVGEKINGRIILEGPLVETEEIVLKYYENIFTIEFAGLHYVNPKRNQYAYKMEGINDDWEHIGNRRFVPYTKIPPGNYTFRVIASNNDGLWNYKGRSLKIRVIPPFWKTMWFQIGFVIFLIVLVYLIVLFRVKAVKLQKVKLEILVEERTKELRESNATKDKFFSIISHDLKSPFNALLGFAEILVENAKVLSKDKILKFSNQIFSSAKQLFGLIENLLAWSRTKTGNIKNFPEMVNLRDLLENNISLLRLNAKKKYIKIDFNVDKEISVYVDVNLISTVLRNLLSNAIKFTNDGGIINISAEEKNHFVKISVIDSGVGISKENMEKLFKEEVHFTTKGTQKEMGTGLGLILCKEFVEMSGGKIFVESALGKGTTFTFTLPKYK